MSQPSPPCKLYGEVGLGSGLGLLILAWRHFFWPAQNFCAAAEVFAPQNLWKPRNRLCRRYRYLGGYRWANKSVGLRTKHHEIEVDHDSTLSRCGWVAAAPDPVKVRPLQEFYEIIPVVIFQCMGSSVFCPNKPKKRASACENCKAKRSKSADLCTAMHAPVIWRSVTCLCMQMNRCQGGKSSRLCHRTGSFPVVTVTNLSANLSTLNSCNFVVSWRIELKFVALESWRVSFFNNVSFVAKRWGLKNHPRSLHQWRKKIDCAQNTKKFINQQTSNNTHIRSLVLNTGTTYIVRNLPNSDPLTPEKAYVGMLDNILLARLLWTGKIRECERERERERERESADGKKDRGGRKADHMSQC